jgi:phosphoglycerate dehydrogenase-like enzyme
MWSWPRLTDELLDLTSSLKMLAHLDITQEAARVALSRGIPVSVARSAFSPAVAEMAMTLILTGLRRTSDYHALMRAGREPWVRSFPDDIGPLERELTGRTVGIIGFGRIGRRLAELLAPFHVNLLVCDPFVDESQLPQGAVKLDIDAIAARSEVLVLCAASNEGTNKLLGREQIDLMPTNCLFVNVARAALVDTSALLARLQRGDMTAMIDVFDQEPLPQNDPFRQLPNAYLTPHRAGGILASVDRILTWLTDDIEAFFNEGTMKHRLTESMIPSLDA